MNASTTTSAKPGLTEEPFFVSEFIYNVAKSKGRQCLQVEIAPVYSNGRCRGSWDDSVRAGLAISNDGV